MYRLLLLLYPSSFRAEYGEEMCRDFARNRQQASGFFALAVLWMVAIGDAIRNGLAAHCDLLRQDVRYANRTIRRAPGFAATVVLVAALGIGATTAVFTVADYVLVRPLPYLHSERLVRVWGARPGYLQMELSPPNYLDWKAMATSFESGTVSEHCRFSPNQETSKNMGMASSCQFVALRCSPSGETVSSVMP